MLDKVFFSFLIYLLYKFYENILILPYVYFYIVGKHGWKYTVRRHGRLYRPNVAGLLVLEAVKREVREEMGFLPSQYDLV